MQCKRVMIIDDEPASRRNLRRVIETFKELCVIAEVGDGKTAIRDIIAMDPDILFLDIEMPEVGGFEVASATAHINYQLVFVTAYDQYALDAFNTKAIDYLLKPVRPALIEKCLNKILQQEALVLEALPRQKTKSDSIVLSDGNAVRVIKQCHIAYIEGIGRYRRIHLIDADEDKHRIQTIVSDTTLDEFESQVDPACFIRIHRSYLANLKQVVGITLESRRHFAILSNEAIKIPISRLKVSELKSYLKG